MRVGSELKDAFLEVSSDVENDCTKKSQIKYDDNSGAIAVGDGAETQYVIKSQHKTINELRSAFYPTGTFLHSLLDQASFRDFMGDTTGAEVDKSWRNIENLLTDVTDTNYVLIEESTDLGAYLITTGAVQINVSGTDYRRMANPKGRYLRAADTTITKDGINLASNVPMSDAIQSHNHSLSLRNAGAIFDDGSNRQATDVLGGTATSSFGGDETRPETIVCNLYIKVNE